MAASASEKTSSVIPKLLIVEDAFLGKNRVRKEFVAVEEDAAPTLDSELWGRLPEEVLLRVFARLPVKDILRLRSLNQTWRSGITSPHFQATFEGASLVRIALMVHDKVDGTMFLTQDEGQECFRPGIARCPEVDWNTNVAATVNGLVCVVEHENRVRTYPGDMLELRVFVMNVVIGFRRALPHPSKMPTLPSFVRMDSMPEAQGGYTITFQYAVAGSMLWEVYDSVENRWSRNEEDNMALLNDREAFTMHCMSSPSFHENVAAIYTKARCVKIFNLYESHGDFCDDEYIAHSVDFVSGDLYKLCARGWQHGVWKRLLVAETWELVCECPKLEETWTCLRVMNDVVVLIFKLPYLRKPDAQLNSGGLGIDVGTILKVFHMPTKSWYSFPEKDYVVQNLGVSIRKDYAGPFLVEVKFDVVP